MMRRATFYTFVSLDAEGANLTPGLVYYWDNANPPATHESAVDLIVDGGYKILQLAAGRDWFNNAVFFIALRSDFTVWAWAPYGNTSYWPYNATPMQISFSAATSFIQIDADTEACFAIDNTGRVWGWGNGFVLGTNGFVPNSYNTPRLVSMTGTFTSINTRGSSAMALRNDGLLLAWGDNGEQQLGHAGLGATPDLVAGGITFKKFRVGGGNWAASMGIGTVNDSLYTWGRNLEGQCMVSSATATISSPLFRATSIRDAIGLAGGSSLYINSVGDVFTWGVGNAAYSPAWHSGTTFAPTNRSLNLALHEFGRGLKEGPIFALDGHWRAWAWNAASIGTGTQATSVPTQVAGSKTFRDVIPSRGSIMHGTT